MKGTKREQLFDDHKHLIPKIAKKYMRYGKSDVEYDDLYQEASVGLHLATLEYDPTRDTGQGFERYAVTRMYQSMMPFFCKQNKLTTPYYIVAVATRIKRLGMIGWEPAEIAKALDQSPSCVERALRHLRGVVTISLDAPLEASDNEKRSISDLIPDNSAEHLDDDITVQMFKDTLTGKEKMIFEYMLNEIPQTDMARYISISRTYTSVLAVRIREKYRDFTKVM